MKWLFSNGAGWFKSRFVFVAVPCLLVVMFPRTAAGASYFDWMHIWHASEVDKKFPSSREMQVVKPSGSLSLKTVVEWKVPEESGYRIVAEPKVAATPSGERWLANEGKRRVLHKGVVSGEGRKTLSFNLPVVLDKKVVAPAIRRWCSQDGFKEEYHNAVVVHEYRIVLERAGPNGYTKDDEGHRNTIRISARVLNKPPCPILKTTSFNKPTPNGEGLFVGAKPNSTVRLDASGSFDPDGHAIIGYLWEIYPHYLARGEAPISFTGQESIFKGQQFQLVSGKRIRGFTEEPVIEVSFPRSQINVHVYPVDEWGAGQENVSWHSGEKTGGRPSFVFDDYPEIYGQMVNHVSIYFMPEYSLELNRVEVKGMVGVIMSGYVKHFYWNCETEVDLLFVAMGPDGRKVETTADVEAYGKFQSYVSLGEDAPAGDWIIRAVISRNGKQLATQDTPVTVKAYQPPAEISQAAKGIEDAAAEGEGLPPWVWPAMAGGGAAAAMGAFVLRHWLRGAKRRGVSPPELTVPSAPELSDDVGPMVEDPVWSDVDTSYGPREAGRVTPEDTPDSFEAQIHEADDVLLGGIIAGLEGTVYLSDRAIDVLATMTGPGGKHIQMVHGIAKNFFSSLSDQVAKNDDASVGKALYDVGVALVKDEVRDKLLGDYIPKSVSRKWGNMRVSNIGKVSTKKLGETVLPSLGESIEKHLAGKVRDEVIKQISNSLKKGGEIDWGTPKDWNGPPMMYETM